MTNRMVRVCELVKRELGTIVSREIEFGGALVTINAVNVTPDLKQGSVFVGVIGAKTEKEEVVRKLNSKSGFLWKRLTGRITLKYTPRLTFHLDESVERGVRTLNAIAEVDALPTATDSEDEDEAFEGDPGDLDSRGGKGGRGKTRR